jgi:hypothetical protein
MIVSSPLAGTVCQLTFSKERLRRVWVIFDEPNEPFDLNDVDSHTDVQSGRAPHHVRHSSVGCAPILTPVTSDVNSPDQD